MRGAVLNLTERHFNAAGGVMGGVHFVLADFTFAVATNWNGMGVVSLSSTISYLGAVERKETDCGSRMCQGRQVYRLLPGECY